MTEREGGPDTITVSKHFKLVFLSVLALTVSSLGIFLYLVVVPPEGNSDNVAILIGTCDTMFKIGFGAIVGLLGGKALT